MGTRSRVWSVPGKVGSQPWSAVSASRSPLRSLLAMAGNARSISRSAAAYPIGFRAVSIEHVGIDQVDEEETVARLGEQLLRLGEAVRVPFGVQGTRDSAPIVDVGDLAYADDPHPRLREQIEHQPRGRLLREIAAVVRTLEGSPTTDERTRDDAGNTVSLADFPRRLAIPVQRGERDLLLVRGDLEDGVRARVDDGKAGAQVFLAEILDDYGAARRLVAEVSGSAAPRQPVLHQAPGKPVREGGEALLEDDPHHLPVAGGGVLSVGQLRHRSATRARRGGRRTPVDGGQITEAPTLQGRQRQAARGPRSVGKRVGAGVAVLRGVGQRARSAGIDDDDDEAARHQYLDGGPEECPVTMATLALAPMRLAPASTIFFASAAVRIPPEALTPMSFPTTRRMRATSSAVAPPAPKPVLVFT